MLTYDDILIFWFKELDKSQWWVKDRVLDTLIRDRFLELHTAANKCELYPWRITAEGRLAEIIVLDQFSRNIFRGAPASFASDSLALALAQEAIAAAADKNLNALQRSFLYMPFMHSESLKIQQVGIKLFSEIDIPLNLEFAIKHKEVIEIFGRYPHRNRILNRVSTEAEIAFLEQPGSAF